MKKFLPIICVLFIMNMYAQTNVYKPFPQVYGNWWVRTTTYVGVGSGTQVYTYITDELYFTSGDTVINTLNYKKVNYINKGNATSPVPPLNYIFTGGSYNFAYRNDSINKKVYIILNDSLTEKIWYDFNLNIGDTVKQNYATGNYDETNYPLIVSTIDSVPFCGNYYKKFSFHPTPYAGNICTQLVEGLGFNANFIYTNPNGNCSFEPTVIPATYHWSVDACPNDLADIKNSSTHNLMVKIYPNPTSNLITIRLNASEKAEITVSDILGKEILNQTIGTNTNDIDINVNNLPNGVYFVRVKTNNGNSTQKIVVQH